VLITGGTGFLGRSLARAMASNWDVTLTGRNQKQNMQAEQATGARVLPMDVVRIESVRDAMIEVAPDVVVHAAATKFVDLAERQPLECVDVNVVGSQNVARVAMEQGTSTVLGISTDKASPPIRNTYGLTKALMERMYCTLDEKSSTRFACVRYGNVAWSTGSVLPVWQQMHSTSGVIGSTRPQMRRFFFTVEEAVALVLTALENIDQVRGRVLARHMKAAKIEDLLNTWVAHKGGRWEKIAGRPGEREDEYLIGDLELPFTQSLVLSGVQHYLIDFNARAAAPLPDVLSSANTSRLTEAEMLALIEGQRE
jgi:FlaA1/EpsC-like NDP-sugar epimerase